MTADREHIATLERMLARTEATVRRFQHYIDEFELNPATADGIQTLRTQQQYWHAEADALEWALEKVT